MDNIEEVLNYINLELKQDFSKDIKLLENQFIENKIKIQNDFIEKLNLIINRKLNLSNDIYIIISPLKSSLITKKYELIMMCCDDELYLDNNIIYEYFNIDFLVEYIKIDICYIKEEVMKNFKNLMEFELQEIILKYSEKYFILYLHFIRQILIFLQNIELLYKFNKKIIFLYGGFFEKLDVIFELKESI